jgi:hypothetical protein
MFLEQEDGANITANSLHPGVIVTNIFRHDNILNSMLFIKSRYKHAFLGVIGLKPEGRLMNK